MIYASAQYVGTKSNIYKSFIEVANEDLRSSLSLKNKKTKKKKRIAYIVWLFIQ